MKKLILSVTAIAGLAVAGHAQLVLFNDGNQASSVSYDVTIYGVADTAEDLNMQLLVGPTAGSVTTDVVTLLLSQTTATSTTALGSVQPAAGDISSKYIIFDHSNNAYKVPAGTAYYEILVWTGNFSSYAAAYAGDQPSTGLPYLGSSGVLQFDDPYLLSGALAPAAEEDLPRPINLISNELDSPVLPEPSTLTMAGVGIASVLIFRRR